MVTAAPKKQAPFIHLIN